MNYNYINSSDNNKNKHKTIEKERGHILYLIAKYERYDSFNFLKNNLSKNEFLQLIDNGFDNSGSHQCKYVWNYIPIYDHSNLILPYFYQIGVDLSVSYYFFWLFYLCLFMCICVCVCVCFVCVICGVNLTQQKKRKHKQRRTQHT